jgi:hypothetical protein
MVANHGNRSRRSWITPQTPPPPTYLLFCTSQNPATTADYGDLVVDTVCAPSCTITHILARTNLVVPLVLNPCLVALWYGCFHKRSGAAPFGQRVEYIFTPGPTPFLVSPLTLYLGTSAEIQLVICPRSASSPASCDSESFTISKTTRCVLSQCRTVIVWRLVCSPA